MGNGRVIRSAAPPAELEVSFFVRYGTKEAPQDTPPALDSGNGVGALTEASGGVLELKLNPMEFVDCYLIPGDLKTGLPIWRRHMCRVAKYLSPGSAIEFVVSS
jgi:hypothetical protein